jgi:ABC transport system ATP-binding/permease protein
MSFKDLKDYEQIDGWIAETEEGIKSIMQQMEAASSDSILLQQLADEQQKLEAKLDQLLERWTELNELAEQIAANKKG